MSGTGKSALVAELRRHGPFDRRVLLIAPREVIAERLRTRTTNPYGSTEAELAQVFSDLDEIEPLVRRTADLVLNATELVPVLADRVLRSCGPFGT